MKLLIFCSRKDEMGLYEKFNRCYHFQMKFTRESLTAENAGMTKGYESIAILTSCRIDRRLAFILKENGVKYVLSRASGTDHMDLPAMAEAGLMAANVPTYSPYAIAEHAVMMMLMLLRHMKCEIQMVNDHNFTLDGLKGRELRKMTVGIFGLGRIGTAVAEILNGFGCKVIAYKRQTNDQVSTVAEYVSREELFHRSDILSFHCPLNQSTRHILSRDAIAELKDGVFLINTARGELFDFKNVLQGLKSGKIGALAMDVFEGENEFMRKNLTGAELQNPVFRELLNMENVLFTSHIGFYTEQAVASMIETSLKNLYDFITFGTCMNQLT